MIFPPDFHKVVGEFARLVDTLGGDDLAALWAVDVAAPQLLEAIHRIALKMGLIPDPMGYEENGDPVYSLLEMFKLASGTEEEAHLLR